MYNSRLNKLKFVIKNGTEASLNLSSKVIGYSIDETNFSHKLLSTDTQVSSIHKAFANGSSPNTKLSKTQLSMMVQLGEFLGRLLRSLLRTGVSLIKNVLKPLGKSVLIPLILTVTACATDVAVHKKSYGSGMTAWIISN